MKKVTVITLHNVRNYGSVLQALATQHVVQELGGDVDFINYNKNGGKSLLKRISSFTNGKGALAKLYILLYCVLYIVSFFR